MKETIFWTLLFIGMICLCIFVAAKADTPESYWEKLDKKCQKEYGKEYRFIEGDRSPDLCVTKDGEVKYFDLIK